MLKLGCDVALILERIDERAWNAGIGGDDLDRHLAFGPPLLSQVDNAHAAASQHGKESKVGQLDGRCLVGRVPTHGDNLNTIDPAKSAAGPVAVNQSIAEAFQSLFDEGLETGAGSEFQGLFEVATSRIIVLGQHGDLALEPVILK